MSIAQRTRRAGHRADRRRFGARAPARRFYFFGDLRSSEAPFSFAFSSGL
jgi:hypothetical protein